MPTDQPVKGYADQTLEPTPIEAWKPTTPAPVAEEEGFIAELPSGNVVRMTRTLDLGILLKTGQIPNPLAGIVQGMIDSRSTTFPEDKVDQKVLMDLLDLLNETAVRAIISPPFDAPDKRGYKDGRKTGKVESPEEYQARLETWQPGFTEKGAADHKKHDAEEPCNCQRKISAWDLDMQDRFFIFAVAQGAAADLASFRSEQERLVAGLQAGEGVRKPTKRTGGAKPRKKK